MSKVRRKLANRKNSFQDYCILSKMPKIMLSEIILQTLRYFDIQDHALTLLEIDKYLLKGSVMLADQDRRAFTVSEVLGCLENDLKEQIGFRSGFYFIKGRDSLAEKRLHNNFYSGKRLKRVHKYLPGVRHLPFVSAAALTGSEALNNSKQGSDIDVLIFVKPNRIWLARLFVSAYFQILGMRRHGKYVENRFCLNHYIQELKVLSDDRNIYTAIEYISLIPYFGADVVYEFQTLNLPWVKNHLLQPEFVKYKTPQGSLVKSFFESLLRGGFGNWLEGWVGSFQKRRIKVQEYILVDKDELSFHPASKGQQVLKRFSEE